MLLPHDTEFGPLPPWDEADEHVAMLEDAAIVPERIVALIAMCLVLVIVFGSIA